MDGLWWGSSALIFAARFPYAYKNWKEDVKEVLKGIWENDPNVVGAT